MYVGPSSLVLSAVYGAPATSASDRELYETLSQAMTGTFDPTAGPPVVTQLLDLSTAAESSGLTIFDVLARSYAAPTASYDLLAAYDRTY